MAYIWLTLMYEGRGSPISPQFGTKLNLKKKKKNETALNKKKKENQEERTQSGSPNGATKLQLPFCGISS